jgi:hypothetical protein
VVLAHGDAHNQTGRQRRIPLLAGETGQPPEKDFPFIGAVGHPLAAADFHVGLGPQKISYIPSSGFLWYNPNGGPIAWHFATLTSHPVLTHAAFIVEA